MWRSSKNQQAVTAWRAGIMREPCDRQDALLQAITLSQEPDDSGSLVGGESQLGAIVANDEAAIMEEKPALHIRLRVSAEVTDVTPHIVEENVDCPAMDQ
jgi:hypothetical protein